MKAKNKIRDICVKAKDGSRQLALVNSNGRRSAIFAMAEALKSNGKAIIRENAFDVRSATRKGLSAAGIDRLRLDDKRIALMADSMVKVARLDDPVGRVLERTRVPNGLLIEKVTVPIGVILVIYESRPNVTADCIALCLKSANAVILRGGSEAIRSNLAIYNVLKKEALRQGIPGCAITMIEDTDRSAVRELLKQNTLIDLVTPRGGESLIREVVEHSRIPVIKHYKGVCHTFVDRYADLKMAEEVSFNAKVQRPGVCNAMETMLVDRPVAKAFLPGMIRRFAAAGVEIRGSADVRKIVKGVRAATEDDWYTEYLALILSVRVVDGLGEAIKHINKYGSGHSDAIVTKNRSNAARFLKEVDSACVYVNASTRFTDGYEFGKGAEIGVSTDKIHARGPMGAAELTSYKYIVRGSGQIRR